MLGFFRNKSTNSVDVNELYKLSGEVNLIDIREPYEYKSGHLPMAKSIPMGKILLETEKYLDKSKEYHIICQTGSRSSRACRILKEKGFNIINVSGGIGRYSGKLNQTN